MTGVPVRRRITRNTQGFTLLEILIVLVIIAVAAGMVQWSIGSHKEMADLRQDAEDAGALLAFARDYGLAHQQALGLMVGDSGYELMVYDEQDGRWHSLGGDANDKKTLAGTVRLVVESQEEMPDIPDADGMGPPAALIDADGTISPCRIAFEWRDNPALAVMLTVGNDGDITITPRGGSDGAS